MSLECLPQGTMERECHLNKLVAMHSKDVPHCLFVICFVTSATM